MKGYTLSKDEYKQLDDMCDNGIIPVLVALVAQYQTRPIIVNVLEKCIHALDPTYIPKHYTKGLRQ